MDFRERMRTRAGGAQDALNDLLGPGWVTFSEDASGVSGVSVAARFAGDSEGRKTLVGLLLLGDALTADTLRRVSVTNLENSANLSRKGAYRDMRTELRRLGALQREEGMSPEQFSELVAAHYRVWARYTPHPAAAMAAEHGIKAPTVAGWIREARLRGLLPPARGRSKAARS